MSIIFSDVDGTIYGPDNTISKQTIKDIKLAESLGVSFAIATGNAPFDYMKSLGNKLGAKYLISSNGSIILNLEIKEFIYIKKIKAKLANKILEIANENKISCDWWDEKNIYTNLIIKDEFKELLSKAMFNGQKVDYPKLNIIKQDILKIECHGTPEEMDKLMVCFKKIKLNIARMVPTRIEITQKNVSKGNAIEFLCKKLKININEVMGIGDSGNDESMLKKVGYSYAMANAPQEVKSWAKYHTTRYNQNGLGMAIVDFLHRTKKDRK